MMEGSQEADDAFEGTLEAIQGDSALVQVGCFFFHLLTISIRLQLNYIAEETMYLGGGCRGDQQPAGRNTQEDLEKSPDIGGSEVNYVSS